jgi:tetratricopeptide (TPR) repeat protein
MTNHSDAELLAAFVDGQLEREELAAVTAHLASCEECRGVVGEAVAFGREVAQSASPGNSTAKWAIAAAVVLAVGIGARELRQPVERWRYRLAVGPLNRAFQATGRPLEPRLAGFDWSEQEKGRDANGEGGLKIAAGRILEELGPSQTVNGRHAAAVVRLALGNPRTAVEMLSAATSQAPHDAAALNDLAVAHYQTGIHFRQPEEFSAALDAANRALQIDNTLPEAHFNRALILEKLGRKSEADAAWREYLGLDGESKWAGEARRHLRLGEIR